MSDLLRAVVGDYRRNPSALLAVAATLVVPALFFVGATLVVSLPRLLVPFGLLVLALVAQVGRLASAPATAVGAAMLAGEPVREAIASAQARAADRVVAAAVERALVVVGTAVVGTVVLCVGLAFATIGGYGLTAAGVDAPQSARSALVFALLVLLVVGAGIGALLRLGTSLAGEVSATRAPAAALSLARRRPTAAVTLVTLRVAPWMTILFLFVYVLLSFPQPAPMANLAATIIVAVGATILAEGLERRVVASASPPIDPPTMRSVLPGRRAALASVLVLAAVTAPTMAVRVADAGPTMGTANPMSGDASAESVLATANDATRRTNHYENATSWRYNDTTGQMERAAAFDRGWDPTDEQVLLVPEQPGDELVSGPIFFGDGTAAFGYEVPFSSLVSGLFVYDADRWTVVAAPGESLGMTDRVGVDSRLQSIVDDDKLQWRVLSRSDDTIVVGVERPERLAEPFGVDADAVAADSYVRLTVDAETGRPQTLSVNRNVTTDDGHRHVRTVVHYREWGTYDLKRPEPIRRPSTLELFWDVLSY